MTSRLLVPLVLSMLVHASSAAAQARPSDRLVLRFQGGPTYVHGSSLLGGTGHVAIDVGFARMFAFEAFAGGGFAGRGHAGRGNLRAGLGLRVGARSGASRPYLGVRAAHVHEAPLSSFRDHPGQALTGDPTHGLGHVTLVGGTAGFVLVPRGTTRLRATVELESLIVAHTYERTADPDGLAPRAYTTLSAGIGLALR